MNIRKVKLGDEEGITRLLSDMGYGAEVHEVKERFLPILNDPQYLTLVTEEKGELIGMLGMHYERSYVANILVARIITMVTAKEYRQQGIGRKLMEEAERRADDKGATTVVLNSGNREERRAAHQFYEACGYVGKSTGFYKALI